MVSSLEGASPLVGEACPWEGASSQEVASYLEEGGHEYLEASSLGEPCPEEVPFLEAPCQA